MRTLSAPLRLAFVAPLLLTAAIQAQQVVVPAAQATTLGNSQTTVPLGSTPTRYQQVFLGSELKTPLTIRCLGFRFAPTSTQFVQSRAVEIEVKLGETTLGPQTLTANFANNFDRGAPLTIIKRQFVTLPPFGTKTVLPGDFELQLPTDVPFRWSAPSANLLLDITVWSNSYGNRSFSYPLDSVQSSAATSCLLTFNGPTATTGKVIPGSGLVIRFADRSTLASYGTFGTGCAGSGHDGIVLPPNARTAWLDGNPLTVVGWRAQQQIEATALPAAALIRSVSFRAIRDFTYNPSTPSTPVTVEIGYTNQTLTTMSASFASNRTDPMTTVFQGTISPPPLDPRLRTFEHFDFVLTFSKPYIYTQKPGKNLLLDIDCNAILHGFELDNTTAGTAPGAIVSTWMSGDRTSPTGAIQSPACFAIRFDVIGSNQATPRIYSTGLPILGKSYDVRLKNAVPAAPALLAFGYSNQFWSGLPLPFDLTPLGAPGCPLQVGVDFAIGTVTSASGDGAVTVPLPRLPAFLGAELFNQLFVLDPAVNTLGLVFSNGGVATLGDI